MQMNSTCDILEEAVYIRVWNDADDVICSVCEEHGLNPEDFSFYPSVKFIGVERLIEFLTDLALDNMADDKHDFARANMEHIRILQRQPSRFQEISANYVVE